MATPPLHPEPPENSAKETGLPFAEALQGLLPLVEMMRSMRPADGSVNPTIILSSAGIELRMSAGEPVRARSEAPSPEWLARVENALEAVRQSTAKLQETVAGDVRKLEAMLHSQAESIETLRAAAAQNEQLVESIVESLSSGEGFSAEALGTLGDEAPLAL